MGIEVVVEDAHGAKIASLEDPTNLLHRVLPASDDTNYQVLNRVDWYGDTTFNRHQIADFRQELQRLMESKKTPEELQLLAQIDAMAEQSLRRRTCT